VFDGKGETTVKNNLRQDLKDLGFDVDGLADFPEPTTDVHRVVTDFSPEALIVQRELANTARREREARSKVNAKISRGKWDAHLESFSKQFASDAGDLPPSGMVCSARLGKGPILL